MASAALDVATYNSRPGNSPGDILIDQMETFCAMDRPKVSDIFTVKEMFYSLIAKTGTDQKRRISNVMARNPYIPRQLAMFMALQPIEVATPVLLFSPVLGERDFMAILEKCDKSHAYIIARRPDLTARMVSQLHSIDNNNRSLEGVLENKSNARERFKKSGRIGMQPIRPPLKVAASNPEPLRTAAPVAAQVQAQDRREELLRLARLGKNAKIPPKRKPEPQAPKFKPAAFGQRLIALLHDSDYDRVSSEIEAVCGLSRRIVMQYIRETNAGTLASILYLLSVPHYTAARILLMLCPKIGRDHSIFIRVMKEFSKLDRATAIEYFRTQDGNFSLPTKQHHIIEARPMLNALRRNSERRARDRVASAHQQLGVLKAG